MSLESVRDEHRRWLDHHGLLHRPWLVLGSAPDPNVPPGLGDRALVCINNAGVAAARMGLPPANLTFRNKNKEWKSLSGHKVPLVLWVCDRTPFQMWLKRLVIRGADLGEIRVMARNDRREVYEHMLREASDAAEIGKPSTGIFAVLYALFVGIPDVLLAGMSLDKQGYSYNAPRARMLHGVEDRFALERIARRYPAVRTTEPVIAEGTGVPLYS
jgi:hypothetical protein